jgi:hypothetical protein
MKGMKEMDFSTTVDEPRTIQGRQSKRCSGKHEAGLTGHGLTRDDALSSWFEEGHGYLATCPRNHAFGPMLSPPLVCSRIPLGTKGSVVSHSRY